jgi:PKD repeat protein
VIRTKFLCAAALSVLFPLGAASAQLGFPVVGPIDPNNGFPTSYTDTNGLSLDLCTTDPLLCLLDAPITLSNPALAFPDNYGGTFPDELFWQRVDSIMPTNGGGQALLVIALEAAFANGPVAAGDQVAFGRVRLRLDNLVAGATYTCTTPVGVFNLVAAAAGPRGINFTSDVGLVPGVFTGVGTNIGPFLKWDSGLPILDVQGRSYVGDPNIEHTITGSPTGTNFFRIDGPSVGGPGVDRIETNLFLVMGLESGVAPPPAAPVAAFNSAPNSGTAPLSVAFTDASTGTISSWQWSFGDAGTSTLQNPTHVYGAGTFSVTLTVTGPGGTSSLTKPALIAVVEPPPGNALVLANPVPGTAGVQNSLVVRGCTPGRTVGVYTGLALGASIVNVGNCGGIPIGLNRPFRLAGRANASAAGVATILTTPPATSAGRVFHFQAVEPASCRTSNLVSDQL